MPEAPPTPEAIADEIEAALRAVGRPERADGEKAYLKSDLDFLGATVPQIRRAVREALERHPELDRQATVELATVLWRKPVHERRFAAAEVLRHRNDVLEPSDVALVERLLREARTWAYVDNLAVSVAGPLVERYPELEATLDRWATDGDFWLRRAALLAHLEPLRRGEGDFERFGRYADAMLDEREFFVAKAIGWVLRETGKRRPELVFEWLFPRIARAGSVTVREAVKHLPEALRDELLAARGTRARRAGRRG